MSTLSSKKRHRDLSAVFIQREPNEQHDAGFRPNAFGVIDDKIQNVSLFRAAHCYSLHQVTNDGHRQECLMKGDLEEMLTEARAITAQSRKLKLLLGQPFIAVNPAIFSEVINRPKWRFPTPYVGLTKPGTHAVLYIKCLTEAESLHLAETLKVEFDRLNGKPAFDLRDSLSNVVQLVPR